MVDGLSCLDEFGVGILIGGRVVIAFGCHALSLRRAWCERGEDVDFCLMFNVFPTFAMPSALLWSVPSERYVGNFVGQA